MNQAQIAGVFTILPLVWGFVSYYETSIFPSMQRKNKMILAALLGISGSLCRGPSKILNFPDILPIIIFSQVLNGMFIPFLIIPALPEMIDSAKNKYPMSSTNDINDISAGLFNMFLGIGQICGPVYSSTMAYKFGYRTCCDSVAYVSLGFGIMYFLCTRGRN